MNIIEIRLPDGSFVVDADEVSYVTPVEKNNHGTYFNIHLKSGRHSICIYFKNTEKSYEILQKYKDAFVKVWCNGSPVTVIYSE